MVTANKGTVVQKTDQTNNDQKERRSTQLDMNTVRGTRSSNISIDASLLQLE